MASLQNESAAAFDETQELTIECPNHKKGQIIGPRGSTIRSLQEKTGASINISNNDPTCIIRGTKSQVKMAQDAINSILNPPSISTICDSKYVGQLIGPRGATIRTLQQVTGARIDVNSRSNPCTINISGPTKEICEHALTLIREIINPPVIQLTCTQPQFIGLLIGPRGSNIRKLQEDTGARIDVDSKASPAMITITGPSEEVRMKAKEKVLTIIQPPQANFHCSSNKRLGRLIGPKGSTIKRLQEMTNTRILVNDQSVNGSGEGTKDCGVIINISGTTIDGVERARSLIQGILTPLTMNLTAPKDVASGLIGDHGGNIEELRNHCNELIGQHYMESKLESKFETKVTVEYYSQVDPLIPYIEIELLGAWYDHDERTITVQLESNYQNVLETCKDIVQHEIDAVVRSQDYIGEIGAAHRKEANKLSMQRSALMEASQKAFINGDREEAKKLSEEAKIMGEKMKEANKLARDAIYIHRNKGKEDTFLDLHGLYVQEALYYLNIVLNKFLSNDVEDQLECVTGAGHHSPMGIAKIKKAVTDLCNTLGLRCKLKNEGAFIIYC
jgi:rRNA processing protein Krr1/Pno1/DNA-nicking Smr family endonuclease